MTQRFVTSFTHHMSGVAVEVVCLSLTVSKELDIMEISPPEDAKKKKTNSRRDTLRSSKQEAMSEPPSVPDSLAVIPVKKTRRNLSKRGKSNEDDQTPLDFTREPVVKLKKTDFIDSHTREKGDEGSTNSELSGTLVSPAVVSKVDGGLDYWQGFVKQRHMQQAPEFSAAISTSKADSIVPASAVKVPIKSNNPEKDYPTNASTDTVDDRDVKGTQLELSTTDISRIKSELSLCEKKVLKLEGDLYIERLKQTPAELLNAKEAAKGWRESCAHAQVLAEKLQFRLSDSVKTNSGLKSCLEEMKSIISSEQLELRELRKTTKEQEVTVALQESILSAGEEKEKVLLGRISHLEKMLKDVQQSKTTGEDTPTSAAASDKRVIALLEKNQHLDEIEADTEKLKATEVFLIHEKEILSAKVNALLKCNGDLRATLGQPVLPNDKEQQCNVGGVLSIGITLEDESDCLISSSKGLEDTVGKLEDVKNQGPEKTDNDEAVGDDANAVVQFKNGLEEKEKLVAQLKMDLGDAATHISRLEVHVKDLLSKNEELQEVVKKAKTRKEQRNGDIKDFLEQLMKEEI